MEQVVEEKAKEYSMVRYIKKRIANNKNFLCTITGPTGCLAGDTIINTSRCEVGRPYSIKYLYDAMKGNVKRNGKRWDLSKQTYVRSFDGNIIRLNKLKEVFYSGIKKVFKLNLENGLSIKATADHKFLTKTGWIELSKLTANGNYDEVMCDTLNSSSSNRKRIRLRDIGLCVGKNHPYNIQPNGQIAVHILIYESRMNNLSFMEYLDILLNEPKRCRELKYINPSIQTVHHKDGCHYNNSIENLELLPRQEHYLKHNEYTNFSQGVPKFSRVLSIQSCGEEETYDIECEEPNHNFVANGMIVHNSGKTWTALSIAKLLDPTFDINRVIFKGRELMNLINNGNLKPGSVIVWDEAGIDLSNRNWQSVTNKMLNALLQTFRHKNIIVFFTVPYNDFVDAATKKLFHADFETQHINKGEQTTTIKPKLLQYNSNMGKWYRKYLKLSVNKKTIKIRSWNVPKPDNELVKEYEIKRSLFTKNLNKDIDKQLAELEEPDEDDKSVEVSIEHDALTSKLTAVDEKIWAMHKQGKSTREIARAVGYRSGSTISARLSVMEEKFELLEKYKSLIAQQQAPPI